MTVGIYYATTTGKTEDVADRLHNFISSAEAPKDVSDVDDLSEFEGLDGDYLWYPYLEHRSR